MAILDDHSSTITSIRFTEEKGAPKKRLKLVSSGADKQIVMRTITPGNETEQFTAALAGKEQCKSKVFSLDVACGHTVTGHDKYMQMWTGALDKEWERKAESQKKQAVLDHLKVSFGPLQPDSISETSCDIVIASCADKTVTIYEAATGNAVCRTTCGEVTLAMCLSNNLRHLITASMDGNIYIWKLPESLTKALLKLRADQAALAKQASTKPAEPETLEPPPTLNKSEEFDFDIPERPSEIEETVLEEATQPPATISMIMQQITKVAD